MPKPVCHVTIARILSAGKSRSLLYITHYAYRSHQTSPLLTAAMGRSRLTADHHANLEMSKLPGPTCMYHSVVWTAFSKSITPTSERCQKCGHFTRGLTVLCGVMSLNYHDAAKCRVKTRMSLNLPTDIALVHGV